MTYFRGNPFDIIPKSFPETIEPFGRVSKAREIEKKVKEKKANKQTCLQSLNNISFGFWLAVRAAYPPPSYSPATPQRTKLCHFFVFWLFFSSFFVFAVFLLWLRFIYKINKCRDGLSRRVSSDIWAVAGNLKWVLRR